MKSKIWSQRSWKWPLDLNNLGRGSVIFFKNCIFKISESSWGKWAIAWLSIQTFKNTSFWHFVLRGHQEVAKNLKFKSLTRKLSYSSFSSAWFTDFKNIIFENKSLSPFQDCWGQEVIFEVTEAKFWISSTFNKFWFRIFVVLDFEAVWPRRPPWPRKRPFLTFQKWPQIIPNIPNINGRYES